MIYLNVENLVKYYGEQMMFDNVSFSIEQGRKTALIARNGTGKTTLLRIISGEDTADGGNVIFRNDISVAYLHQDPVFDETKTVIESIFSSADAVALAVRAYEEAMTSEDSDKIQEAIEGMDRYQAWDFEAKVHQILSTLKITRFNQPIKELSGGQRKRVALANTLINESDLLILDEPTNHLDLDMIEWLENYLKRSKGTLLMVTHDRYFLDRVCNDILELDSKTMYHYKGNYSYFLEKREERLMTEAANIDKAKNLYTKELDWMRRQPQARATKAKARIDAFYEVKEKAFQKRNDDQVQIQVQASRLGKKILEFKDISKRFDKLILLKDFTYTFKRHDKIGIIGKNGVGKSTFLNIITGSLPSDSGTVEVGETVVFGYYKQEGLKVDETKRIIDVIKDIAEIVTISDKQKMSASQFLEYFLFPPAMQYLQVAQLSGGEKRRLYLMTILVKSPNFLILDEPTNDLDILTLNVLEDFLAAFTGSLLIVSHDRYFMDKVTDHLFVFQGEGIVKDFPGNYTDYQDYNLRLEKEKQQPAITKVEKPKEEIVRAPKLTYKQKFELETLEKEIAKLEEDKLVIEAIMSDAGVAHDVLLEKSNLLKEINTQLEVKGDRWLELSSMDA